MTRTYLLSLVLSSTFTFAACGGGGGKANKEDLAKAVVESLAKKDKAAFTALYLTIDQAVSACPVVEAAKDEVGGKLAKSLAKAGESFDECAKLDWSKAKLGAVSGGDPKKREGPCEALKDLKDIEFEADIDGKKVHVELDDPVTAKEAYYLRDRFRCRVADAAGAGDEGRLVADGKPAEADKASAAAGTKAGEAATAADTKAGEAPAGTPTTAPPGAEKPADPATAAPTTAPATGSSECDKFIASYETCLAAMPESVRGQAADGLKQMKQTFAGMPDKSALDTICKQSYDSAKTALASLCPNAFK